MKTKIIFTHIIVENFRIIFYNVFSSKKNEIEDFFILFEIKLIELYQRLNKLLSIYYKKTYNLIKRINVKNHSILISIFPKFNSLKSTFLNIVFEIFIRNLIDLEIRKKKLFKI